MSGFAAGDKYIVRYTNDGGTTWNLALPASIPTTNVPDIKTVYCTGGSKAFAGGTQKFFASVNNGLVTTVPGITGSTNITFHAIAFSNPQYGIAVDDAPTGPQGRIIYTQDGGANWLNGPTVNFGIRAVWAFKRNNWALFAGTGGKVNGMDLGTGALLSAAQLPGAVKNVPGNNTINDIFFHDDLAGYLVGEKGNVFRSEGFALDESSLDFRWKNQGAWKKPIQNGAGADGLNNQSQDNKLNITSIAFATRYDGFMGGDYNDPPVIKNYARLIHDETNLFSTRFWYDKLGRIVLSQNSRQYKSTPSGAGGKYSYTLYDFLGRVIEAGEKKENTGNDPKFSSVFGSVVNNHFNPRVIDDVKLITWLNAGPGSHKNRKEVTRTFYDSPQYSNIPLFQQNLRKRISSVTFSENYNASSNIYDHATHYSYDIHGNVKSLLQDNNNPDVVALAQQFKRIDYTYDLISGNVHEVKYQENEPDQWFHKYTYDDDNRIKKVETISAPLSLWGGAGGGVDAKYFYYAHGPLARVELGNDKVQGMDYAYTLQGWLKGVNSNTLDSTRDIGQDGNKVLGNPNSVFARDVFGYSLGYFNGDYKDIGNISPQNNFLADLTGSDLLSARNDLFNGNISSMATTLSPLGAGASLPNGMAYRYDQLNRLTKALGFWNLDETNNKWTDLLTVTGLMPFHERYKNNFTYDASGNILTQKRHAEDGTPIDDMTYRYKRSSSGQLLQNRLYHVNDAVNPALHDDDIDDQGIFDNNPDDINQNNNYSYDEEGRLVMDKQEGIIDIKWTVTGKVKEVIRINGFSKTVNNQTIFPSDLEFKYDALGNRIAKIEKPRNQNNGNLLPSADWITTFYVRDAQGNVISVYKLAAPSSMTSYKQIEKHIYGSSRVGMETTVTEMIGAQSPSTTNFTHVLGNKQFEMGNHLGNVLAVVTDKKNPVDDKDIAGNPTADGIVDYYKAELLVSTDYYPFGTVMKGRDFTSDKYRYGFNRMEKDDEAKGSGNSYDYGMRFYDSRLGRFLSIDPIAKEFPWYSPYQFAGNKVITSIDLEGAEEKNVQGKVEANLTYTFGSSRKNIKQDNFNLSISGGGSYQKDNSTMLGGSLSINLYNGGLGTAQGTKGRNEFQGDFTLSGTITKGSGDYAPMPISTFNANTLTPIDNNFKNSFTYGFNITLNTEGRNQTTSSIGVRSGEFSATTYNDVKYFRLGLFGNDRWWTGGFKADIIAGDGIVSIGGDVFTTERMENKSGGFINVGTGRKNDVYAQKDRSYNNAMTFFQYKSALTTARVELIGSKQMFWSNVVHFTTGDSFFKSKAKNDVRFSGGLNISQDIKTD